MVTLYLYRETTKLSRLRPFKHKEKGSIMDLHPWEQFTGKVRIIPYNDHSTRVVFEPNQTGAACVIHLKTNIVIVVRAASDFIRVSRVGGTITIECLTQEEHNAIKEQQEKMWRSAVLADPESSFKYRPLLSSRISLPS